MMEDNNWKEELPPNFAEKPEVDATAVLNKLVEVANTEEKKPVVEVSDADRHAFVTATFKNQPFTKSFSLFGGGVKVTFKTLKCNEVDAVVDALSIISRRVPFTSSVSIAVAQNKLNMATAISELVYSSGIETTHANTMPHYVTNISDPYESTHQVKHPDGSIGFVTKKEAVTPGLKILIGSEAMFGEMSIVVYNAIFKAYEQFNAIINQLVTECADPDFFTRGRRG